MDENFQKAKHYPFPKDLPVLFFLAMGTAEEQEFLAEQNPLWIKQHEDLIQDLDYAKVYPG